MIALFSALLGFFTSAAPKIFDAFQDGRDKAQEIKLLELQIQQGQQKADSDLSMTLAQATAAQNAAIQSSYQNDIESATKLGEGFVVALSASVRPVITYAFFALYAAVKVATWYGLLHPSLPWQQALTPAQAVVAIWGEEDMALFSIVLAFWFGNRLFKK